MRCFYCNKSAKDAVVNYLLIRLTPEEYIEEYWCSYNKHLDTFACEDCMAELDLPVLVFNSDWNAGIALNDFELLEPFNGGG